MPSNNTKSNGNESRKEHHQHRRVRHSSPTDRYTGNRHERMGTLRVVQCHRPDHSGRDKGSLQEWRVERVRDKAYHLPIRQVQQGVLQP